MHSIRTRLVVTVVAHLAVTLTVVTATVALRGDRDGSAQACEYVEVVAARHAASVGLQLASAVTATSTIADTLGALRETGDLSRAQVSEMIGAALDDHPDLVGMSTAWEPNAFDGADADYVNTAQSDASGRFVPYWYRDGESPAVTALVDYTDPAVAPWYFVPMQTSAPVLTEPYVYPVSGVDVLMTTAAAPIVVDGTPVGVVAADLELTTLTDSLAQIRPYGTGYVALLTDQATVVTHPDAELLGSALAGPTGADALAVSDTGEAASATDMDATLDARALTTIAPLAVTENQTWSLLVSAPEAVALAPVTTSRNTTIGLSLVALLIAGASVWLLGTRLTRPIAKLRDRLVAIADVDGD